MMAAVAKIEVVCPYCQSGAVLVTGDKIYPYLGGKYKSKKYWLCSPCSAYVGCHDGSSHPFGSLANRELRAIRIKAHAAFDDRWRSGKQTRSAAYKWLAFVMNISKKEAHIGKFDVDMCKKVIDECEKDQL